MFQFFPTASSLHRTLSPGALSGGHSRNNGWPFPALPSCLSLTRWLCSTPKFQNVKARRDLRTHLLKSIFGGIGLREVSCLTQEHTACGGLSRECRTVSCAVASVCPSLPLWTNGDPSCECRWAVALPLSRELTGFSLRTAVHQPDWLAASSMK